ncbi:hypothetical protein O6H91_12G064600 [Diphasiastrum complanatum]|uniref:Uncharacterized protein n=3 Tax=Diphasiastrum complanatum TaxID=34168 RepID=A0ACC2C2U7_DIPCM|nr:hypothetical protein O6H91_12G064600 [Diphasiastrum complanatum]
MEEEQLKMIMEQLRMSASGSGSHTSSNRTVSKASEAFDKATLVDAHNLMMRQAAEMQQMNLYRLQPAIVEADEASVGLAGLASIRIEELKLGVHHRGRVLYGTLCVDAFKVTGVISLLEDDRGKAVRLLVYNAAVSSSSAQAVRRLFPKDRAVAVKEPYLKRCVDGSIAVRVDNPANIVTAPAAPAPAAGTTHAGFDALRAEGNKRFASQDWLGAIELYSKCIDAATNSLHSSSSSSVKQDASKASVTTYSNRAEAWLRLHKFEKALADANKALELGLDSAPSLLKSFHRKARALCSLQQHKQSCECLEVALQQFPGQEEIRDSLDKCRIHMRQSEYGEYQSVNFLLDDSNKPASIPNYSDYVGAVEIRMADQSMRGRGLFATKDVQMGSLLLVSNAVAETQADRKTVYLHMDFTSRRINTGAQEDIVTKLVDRAMGSPKFLKQLNTLKGSSSASCSLEVPSMELFKPNSVSPFLTTAEELQDESAQIDIVRIREIVKYNAFGKSGTISDSAGAKFGEELADRSCGLWMLPSFINHSCIPNASMIFLGSVMFVHAAHDIRAGEEVTLPYFDALVPYKQRETLCSNWGFFCLCRRCEFERSLCTPLRPIANPFSALHKKARKEFSARFAGQLSNSSHSPECAEFHKLAVKLENTLRSLGNLAPTEKQWIQASFAAAYLAGSKPFGLAMSSDSAGTRLPQLQTLLNSMHATVPGHMMTFQVAAALTQPAVRGIGSDCSSNLAQQLALEVCTSTFGKHNPDALRALLQSYSNKKLHLGGY